MKEVQKPNDIFIATLSAPEASVLDLLQNNINAENTSFLTPDEYKETPFVKKRYTQDGVFNEQAFNQDYLRAYEKFSDLADDEAAENLTQFLEYSSSDRFKPINGKDWNTAVSYKALRNPLGKQYSVTGVNAVGDPVYTPEEAAQSNLIYDPEKGAFTNKTPESLSLWDKFMGDTLVYAKWENNGTHIDPETGQEVAHSKGQWKTDKNGNYYTEYLGNRELLDKQVVALGDILTDEGSFANKLDFFDSDGYDKSIVGTAAKMIAPMIPYLIPGVRAYYAAFTTAAGLASVLPTFYKSIESVFTGKDKTVATDTLTRMENWFRKYKPSKSYKGREGFWNWESIGELVSDTFGQLYQQRAAARAAQWFLNAPKKVSLDASFEDVLKYQADLVKYWKSSNNLGGKASLAYMGLISAADTYNDALNAGYDKRVAGITSLATASALYGIMNFNETTRGIGNWMLDKTTGYNPEVEKGVIRKLTKKLMRDVEKDVATMDKSAVKNLGQTLSKFKRDVFSTMEDIFVIGSEDVWKRFIVESVEETSEEIIQDMIKGVVDLCSYYGFTPTQGSFGGWSNVFSKEGLERYISTFIGGGIGGALFAVQNKFENKFFSQTPQGKASDYTLDDAIIQGRWNEVVESLQHAKKFFNQRQTASLGEVDGKQIYMSANSQDLSQAEVIYQQALNRATTRMLQITQLKEGAQYDPKMAGVYQQLAKAYNESGFDNVYVQKKWENLMHQIIDTQDKIAALQEQKNSNEKDNKPTKDIDAQIKDAETNLTSLQEQLHNWQNGVNLTQNTLAALVYLNPELSKRFLMLDVKSYAQDVLGVDYDKLDDSKDAPYTKTKVGNLWKAYKTEITRDNIIDTVDNVVDVIKRIMPTIGKPIANFVQNENIRNWLLSTPYYDKDGNFITPELTPETERPEYTPIIEYLNNNPGYWSLFESTKYDLATALINDGAINLDENFSKDEQPIIMAMINDAAIHSGITIWTQQNLRTLLDGINSRLTQGAPDDIFVKKIQELREKENEDGKSAVDINIKGINLDNLSKVSVLTEKARVNAILDVVKDMPFVDQEVFRMLKQAFGEESVANLTNKLAYLLGHNSQLATQWSTYFSQNFFKKGNGHYVDITVNTETGPVTTHIPLESNVDTSAWTTPQAIIADSENFLKFCKDLLTFKQEDGIVINLIDAINAPSVEAIVDPELNTIGDFYNKEDLNALLLGLKQLQEAYTENAILPEEVQQAWTDVQNKTIRQNPLLQVVKDVVHKFGVNNDSLIEWLWNKESQVQASQYDHQLSSEDIKDLNDIMGSLAFIKSMIACMEEQTGDRAMASFNGVVRNAILTGNDQQSKIDDFPIFSKYDLQAVNTIINNLADKVATLYNLNEEAVNYQGKDDLKVRSNYEVNLGLKLSQLKLELPDDSVIELSEIEADPENQEAINLQLLTEFRNKVLEWVNTQSDKEEAMNAVIAKLTEKFPKAFLSGLSLQDQVSAQEAFISDGLMFRTLLRSLAISPKELNQLYIKGLTGKALLPRFDQEFESKDLIARITYPELYSYATKLLHAQAEEAGQQDHNLPAADRANLRRYRMPAYNLFRVQGSGGSGKTTTMQIAIDALNPAYLVLVGPTEDKKNDLDAGLTTSGRKESYLFSELLGINIAGSDRTISDEIMEAIQNELSKEEVNKQITDGAESKKVVNLKITHPKINGGKEVGVTVQVESKALLAITFDDDFMTALEDFITDDLVDKFEGATIFVDEVTNLNPVDVVLLNALAKKGESKGITVATYGDKGQIGSTVSIKTLDTQLSLTTNITSFFTDRSPALSGVFRMNNSGRTRNMQNLYALTDEYSEDDFEVIYELAKDTTNIANKLKAYPLLYNGLMGDQIVKNHSEAVEKLKQIVADVQTNKKTFKVIYEEGADINPIKTALKEAGFTDAIVEDTNTYKTTKTVQGAEADYVYVYGLTSAKTATEYADGDIDVKKIYTALSRSKDFTLIEDDPKTNGLFKVWGMKSLEDASVSASVQNAQTYAERATTRVEQIGKIIESLPDDPTVTPKAEPTPILPTVDNSDSEPELPSSDDEEEEIPSTPTEIEERGGGITTSKPVPEGPVNESSSGTEKKNIFDDAAIVYGYYNRVGITKNEVETLMECNTPTEVSNFFNNLESTSTENYKDLRGYWNTIGQYANHQNGQAVLDAFIALKNQMLYAVQNLPYSTDNDLILNMKQKTDADFSYLKPNDWESKDNTGKVLTTILRRVTTPNGEFYITICRVGVNRNDKETKAFSGSLYDRASAFIRNKKQEVNYYLKFKGPGRSRSEYRRYRGFGSTSTGNKDTGVLIDSLIPITSLRNFKIDPTNESNQSVVSADNLQHNRMTVGDLKRFGYQVTQIPIPSENANDFMNLYNSFRFVNVSQKKNSSVVDRAQNVWLLVTPVGLPITISPQSSLVLVNKVIDGTIYDNLRIPKQEGDNLRAFRAKQIISYLYWLTGYNGSFEGINSHLQINNKNSKSHTQDKDNCQKWDNNLSEFIKALQTNNTKLFDEKRFQSFVNHFGLTTDDLTKLAKSIEESLLSTSLFITRGGQFVLNKSISAIQAEPILSTLLKAEESKGFLYDTINNLDDEKQLDSLVVSRVFEAPYAFLDFNEFDISEGFHELGLRSASIEETTAEPTAEETTTQVESTSIIDESVTFAQQFEKVIADQGITNFGEMTEDQQEALLQITRNWWSYMVANKRSDLRNTSKLVESNAFVQSMMSYLADESFRRILTTQSNSVFKNAPKDMSLLKNMLSEMIKGCK